MPKAQASGAARRDAAQRPSLDSVDRRILAALLHSADLTNKALATRLGLAESTCAYRVRALRDAGVILGSRLQVNYAVLGCPLQAIVKVRLGSHDQANVNQLYDDLVAVPGVIQVFHVAGADDFHVYVAVADAHALRDLVLEHITVHRVVRQTETQLVFDMRDGVGVL